MFKRLYTVRAGFKDARDDHLYGDLSGLSLENERTLRQNVADALEDYLPGVGTVLVDEVLVDIPRRSPADSTGTAYVRFEDGSVRAIEEVSAPVNAIAQNYEQLTKRVRFFVSPRVSAVITKARRRESEKLFN